LIVIFAVTSRRYLSSSELIVCSRFSPLYTSSNSLTCRERCRERCYKRIFKAIFYLKAFSIEPDFPIAKIHTFKMHHLTFFTLSVFIGLSAGMRTKLHVDSVLSDSERPNVLVFGRESDVMDLLGILNYQQGDVEQLCDNLIDQVWENYGPPTVCPAEATPKNSGARVSQSIHARHIFPK
jgi:hypothetical protein